MTEPSREQMAEPVQDPAWGVRMMAEGWSDAITTANERIAELEECIRKVRELAGEIECANCDHPVKLHADRCTGVVFADRRCGCTWRNSVADQILAALDGEGEKPPRANGGILPGGVIYQVGESGCVLTPPTSDEEKPDADHA